MANPAPVLITAPAKVNLFLHVVGRRDDGYHLLESLFVFTRKGDEIRLEPADSLSLALDGPFAEKLKALGGDGDGNLVVKAAQVLARAAGRAPDVAISLTKNLPVEGGIGGGSADAAATLVGLNRLWRLDWPIEKLADLALGLGADVPACLYGRPVYVQGIGERIEPVNLPWRAAILLVNAGPGSSTPLIFKAYKASETAFDAPLQDAHAVWQSPENLKGQSHNSLEAAATGLNASVQAALDALVADGQAILSRMSGSGSTCFALYKTLADAEAAKTRLAAQHPDWWLMADELSA